MEDIINCELERKDSIDYDKVDYVVGLFKERKTTKDQDIWLVKHMNPILMKEVHNKRINAKTFEEAWNRYRLSID